MSKDGGQLETVRMLRSIRRCGMMWLRKITASSTSKAPRSGDREIKLRRLKRVTASMVNEAMSDNGFQTNYVECYPN